MANSTTQLAHDSLAWAMSCAAHACVAVRSGRSLNTALDAAVPKHSRAAVRGAIHDLTYAAMRGRGGADAALRDLSGRVPEPPLLRELLVIALVLLERACANEAFDAVAAPHYEIHTIVSQVVEAVAHHPAIRQAKGFANAILRSYLRDRTSLLQRLGTSDEALRNYPDWWVQRVRDSYPQAWEDILLVGNARPPLTLRVNRRKSTQADYLAALKAAGLGAQIAGSTGIILDVPCPVEVLPGFGEGIVSVQDEAAQRAAPLLDVQEGMRVLDACAAPGGKTGHLLEVADLDLTALDSDEHRLGRVADNLSRLGLRANLIAGDAADPTSWWDGRPYNRILADLPCTASGIVRRHPDIRWLRREADIDTLSRRQQQILDALWRLLAPNGKLLIVTCSIFPEETVWLARDFAARHGAARLLPCTGQLLPMQNADANHDGLFFSLIEKTA